jgi:inosine-uridine nucleoside N-ribohydrolase
MGSREEGFAMNRIPLVIDTDAFKEIDDPFAIAYALSCPKTFDVRAILAAPFFNEKSASPADGMEKSLMEIRRVCALMDSDVPSFSGSRTYLLGGGQPVESAAAEALIDLARAMPDDEKLTVAAIAAATNVASALIMAPDIVKSSAFSGWARTRPVGPYRMNSTSVRARRRCGYCLQAVWKSSGFRAWASSAICH